MATSLIGFYQFNRTFFAANRGHVTEMCAPTFGSQKLCVPLLPLTFWGTELTYEGDEPPQASGESPSPPRGEEATWVWATSGGRPLKFPTAFRLTFSLGRCRHLKMSPPDSYVEILTPGGDGK